MRVLVIDSCNIQRLLQKERTVVCTKLTHLDLLRYLHYDILHALVSKAKYLHITFYRYLIELQHFFAGAANYYFCILILLFDLQIVSTYYRMIKSSRGSEDISKIYSVTLALVSTDRTNPWHPWQMNYANIAVIPLWCTGQIIWLILLKGAPKICVCHSSYAAHTCLNLYSTCASQKVIMWVIHRVLKNI